MVISYIDWAIIGGFLLFYLVLGLRFAKSAENSTQEYFLSGRNMSWWLLGISLVATTFSADTPNLVTDIVRKNGVSGNWAWWSFLLTGLLTVFVYARLWRRSNVFTDLEFYELRYSGPPAAFLRFFRAIYLGLVLNVLIMATVCLAAVKIGGVMLGLSPLQSLLIANITTMIYSALGGFKGVLYTDLVQFIVAMVGSITAAIYVVNMEQVGGLTNLLSHPNVSPKLDLLPDFGNINVALPIIIIPLAVQWWSSWYPGSEPGGGGYVAQRMLAAKDEQNALGATFLFNVAHYALRPWPWILVALASLIVFPTHESLQAAFPLLDAKIINDDLAYPAMLSFLPTGLKGLVLASLIAAFMSTISTHLNWGASYMVNDVFRRFINPHATERQLVNIGRITTVVLMILATIIALGLSSAKQAFNILIQLGAGTGLLFILRWFWWRINAYSEIAAMVISFVVAIYLDFIHPKIGGGVLEDHVKLIIAVGITTLGWLIVTFVTQPTSFATLLNFYKVIKPAKIGWNPVLKEALQRREIQEDEIKTGHLPMQILAIFLGCILIYSMLFAMGNLLYAHYLNGLLCIVAAIVSGYSLYKMRDKLLEEVQ